MGRAARKGYEWRNPDSAVAAQCSCVGVSNRLVSAARGFWRTNASAAPAVDRPDKGMPHAARSHVAPWRCAAPWLVVSPHPWCRALGLAMLERARVDGRAPWLSHVRTFSHLCRRAVARNVAMPNSKPPEDSAG